MKQIWRACLLDCCTSTGILLALKNRLMEVRSYAFVYPVLHRSMHDRWWKIAIQNLAALKRLRLIQEPMAVIFSDHTTALQWHVISLDPETTHWPTLSGESFVGRRNSPVLLIAPNCVIVTQMKLTLFLLELLECAKKVHVWINWMGCAWDFVVWLGMLKYYTATHQWWNPQPLTHQSIRSSWFGLINWLKSTH